MIREIKGDIFESDADILVCPVNLVGAMGAGLAYAFRDKHPDLYYHYKKIIRQKRWRDGAISIYKPEGAKYSVLLFPTKYNWKDDADLSLIRQTLASLSRLGEYYQFQRMAIPRVGAGLGNLDYEQEIKPLIAEYLSNTPYDVDLYV